MRARERGAFKFLTCIYKSISTRRIRKCLSVLLQVDKTSITDGFIAHVPLALSRDRRAKCVGEVGSGTGFANTPISFHCLSSRKQIADWKILLQVPVNVLTALSVWPSFDDQKNRLGSDQKKANHPIVYESS